MTLSEHEHGNLPASIPASISAALAAYTWERNTIGESGAAVYRLHGKPAAPALFLKHGDARVAGAITDEMTKLEWLGRHIAVPQVVQFLRTPDEAWLLMSALEGDTAGRILEAHPERGPAVVDAIVAFLRRLHAIPVSACPFNSDHAFRLRLARQRIDAGAVDTDDFDDERAGWTAEQVWEALRERLPLAADPVVTHGDFSLDNIMIHEGEVVGCIDVGRAGIGDRYQDLAILWHGLGEIDESLQERMFIQYGLSAIDRDKLEFHLLLDELF